MIITYCLFPGYASFVSDEKAKKWLKRKKLDLPEIKGLALEMGCPLVDDAGVPLDTYIDMYKRKYNNPIKKQENFRINKSTTFAIKQTSESTCIRGSASRRIQECLRKAACVYLIIEAAKKNINLNLRIF